MLRSSGCRSNPSPATPGRRSGGQGGAVGEEERSRFLVAERGEVLAAGEHLVAVGTSSQPRHPGGERARRRDAHRYHSRRRRRTPAARRLPRRASPRPPGRSAPAGLEDAPGGRAPPPGPPSTARSSAASTPHATIIASPATQPLADARSLALARWRPGHGKIRLMMIARDGRPRSLGEADRPRADQPLRQCSAVTAAWRGRSGCRHRRPDRTPR